jgi:acetoin utilization protein AcuB
VDNQSFLEKIKQLKVEAYTTPTPTTLTPDASLTDIQNVFLDNGFRHIPITENNRVCGLISHRDYTREVLRTKRTNLTAGEMMVQDPFTVHYHECIDTVAFRMSDQKIGSAIVVNEQRELMGIFTTTDALNALIDIVRGELD